MLSQFGRGPIADPQQTRPKIGCVLTLLATTFMCAWIGSALVDPGGTPCTQQMQFNLDILTDNGYQIAFTSDRNAQPNLYNDFVMGANGRNVRPLTSRRPAPLGSSQPSPDGKHIAFISFWLQESNKEPGVYLMDVDGKNVRRLTPDTLKYDYAISLAWSPNGKQIAFGTEGTGSVYVIDIASADARRVFEPSRNGVWRRSEALNWSPDGRFIAFTYRASLPRDLREEGLETTQIYITDTEATGACRVSQDQLYNDLQPVWLH